MLRRRIDRLNDQVRALKLKLVIALFDHAPRPRGKIQRILFLRHDGKIGDSIVTSFLGHELRRNYPEIESAVLISQNNLWTQPYFSGYSKTFVVKKGIWPSIRSALEIRKWKPDVVVNLAYDLKPKTAFFLCALDSQVISLSRQRLKAEVAEPRIDRSRVHFADQVVHCLELLDLTKPVETTYRIQLPDADMAQAQAFLDEQGMDRFVCLNLKASAALKGLSLQAAARVVATIKTVLPEHQICFLGTREERSELNDAFGLDSKVKIAAGLSFAVQMAIVKKSDLIVTPDTSWVHVASAFATPSVIIYRQEDSAAMEFPSLVWAGRGANKRSLFAVGRADYKDEVDASTFSETELQQAINALFSK
ncbi:MAG: glycosyltransferase family 9 protein [Bdellovibrionaceae bacterium]|nr:glycosyltransferase family 9 protein [Pseudobdellovibrionaceae bacterium]